MKAWKIDLSGYTGKVREVVSEAVQKKAFELGYQWVNAKKTIRHDPGDVVILTCCDGSMLRFDNVDICRGYITAADFLELTADKVNEPTFKPFDRVLVRDSEDAMWRAGMFSHFTNDRFYCVGGWYYHCIPYEGNEHLVGTTDSAK